MTGSVVPLLLFLALWLGGSAQGAFGLLVLQLLAATALGWALLIPADGISRPARRLTILATAFAALALVQLIPVPPAVWTALPGRTLLAEGDRLLALSAWRPLSIASEETAGSLAFLLIPLALIQTAVRRGGDWQRLAALVAVGSGVAQAVWGITQQAGQAPRLYAFTSGGPTGAFANTNHLAALSVACLPLIAALIASAAPTVNRLMLKLIGLIVAALLAFVVLLSGSVAMMALFVPAMLASIAIAAGRHPGRLRLAMGASLFGLIAVGLFIGAQSGLWPGGISMSSRADIWARTMGLSDYFATGGGMGSFHLLYQQVEDPFAVTRFFVNHAHNDALQLLVEGGIAGIVLLLLFLAWWVSTVERCWRPDGNADPFAKAGTVVTAILLAHSLVDFPLRTAALATLFAAGISMMAARGNPVVASEPGDLRPTRHRRLA